MGLLISVLESFILLTPLGWICFVVGANVTFLVAQTYSAINCWIGRQITWVFLIQKLILRLCEILFHYLVKKNRLINIFAWGVQTHGWMGMARWLVLLTLNVILEKMNRLKFYRPQKPVYSFKNFNNNIILIQVNKSELKTEQI